MVFLIPILFLSSCGGNSSPSPPKIELAKYTSGIQADSEYSHDGRLRWAVGVKNNQVIRTTKEHPENGDGVDSIFRHHPFITYWDNLFWIMHDYEGQVSRLSWSDDGLNWNSEDSDDIFPKVSTHRTAFYISKNNKLLAVHWVGNETGGKGTRLVREIYAPRIYSQTFKLKNNVDGGYEKRIYPSYNTSTDSGFIEACEEALNNKLYREQWQEEDFHNPDFYQVTDGKTQYKAFNWYELNDGRILGTWKGVLQSITVDDNWKSSEISKPKEINSFGFNGGSKTWGQKTSDGKYAMFGNPPGDSELRRRWPLTVTTSKDGLTFDSPHIVIAGDIPVERYENYRNDDKNAGMQYVRGFLPEVKSPNKNVWLTYSMNKEDIWVSEIPVPIKDKVNYHLNDTFENSNDFNLWNTYNAQWAPVELALENNNHFIRLHDFDPYDYSSVMRVLPSSKNIDISFDLKYSGVSGVKEPLEFDLLSEDGSRISTFQFKPYKNQLVVDNKEFFVDSSDWFNIKLKADISTKTYDVSVNDSSIVKDAEFIEKNGFNSIERIVFRTGEFRLRSFNRRPYKDSQLLSDRVDNPDEKTLEVSYDIDNVRTS